MDTPLIRPLSQPHVTMEGADLIVRYGNGGLLVFVLLGLILLAVAAAFWFWRKRKDVAVILAILAVVVFVVVAPGAAVSSVRVTPTTIRQTTGLWFLPKTDEVDISLLVLVKISSTQSGRWTVPLWTFIGRDGRVQSFAPGDLWIAAAEEIVAELKRRGVRVE